MQTVEILEFSQIPRLEDLLEHGGIPGIDYAYVLGNNIHKAQRDGFSILHRVPSFAITGPKGTAACILMGTGEPITGADPNAGRVCLYVDEEIETLAGLNQLDAEENGGSG